MITTRNMTEINLEGMEFFAHHGCYEEERKTGGRFLVDLHIDADLYDAELSDKLEETIDYKSVYDIVKKEMDQPSSLLEHVGRRIINMLVSAFPLIEYAEVKVSKLNPALGGKVEKVSVVIFTED